MGQRARTIVLAVALILPGALALPAAAGEGEPRVTELAGGLDAPRGLAVGPDGATYVAETGTAGDDCLTLEEEGEEFELCFGQTSRITRIDADGEVDREFLTGLPSMGIVEDGELLPEIGVTDVSFAPDGTMYFTIGLGASAADRDDTATALEADYLSTMGTLHRLTEDGEVEQVADLAAFEDAENPDGSEVPDSNPNGLHATTDAVYVADAGGNSLLEVDPEDGSIALAAVVAPRMQQMPPEFGGEEIPMESVPTSVTESPDGDIVFGELTGFPFPVGGANVYALTADPTEPEVVASGFTAGMSVAFRGGELFVLEFAHRGLLAAFGQGELAGALVRVREDGTRASLLRHVLQVPAGIAIADDEAIHISNGAVFPGGGQVLAFDASGPADDAIDLACPPGAVLPSALSDIAGTTHEEAITCTNWHGLFAGFEDGTFGPQLSITRAQFATTVHRLLEAAGGELPQGEHSFSDVPADHPHAEAIAALAEIDVLAGFEDGAFRPGSRISRDQAASVIVRSYEWLSGAELAEGPDAFVDDDGGVHESAINAAANVGWILGVEANRFAPRRDIERGQVSSVLARVASTLVGDGLLELPDD